MFANYPTGHRTKIKCTKHVQKTSIASSILLPYVQFTFCVQMVYPTLITQILVILFCDRFYSLGTGFVLFIRARTCGRIFPPEKAENLLAINFHRFKVAASFDEDPFRSAIILIS